MMVKHATKVRMQHVSQAVDLINSEGVRVIAFSEER